MLDSVTLWAAANQAFLSITVSLSLLKLMSIESVTLSNHLILFCPLLLLPSIFPTIRVFPSESVLRIKWPKYWSFSFSISPFNEYSGLISFRIDWFDLLASLGDSQNSSPAPEFESILRHSAIFMAQRCVYLTSIHDYWKNYALTMYTFVGKMMSLLFHTLSLL